jgi:hypothetical protein
VAAAPQPARGCTLVLPCTESYVALEDGPKTPTCSVGADTKY